MSVLIKPNLFHHRPVNMVQPNAKYKLPSTGHIRSIRLMKYIEQKSKPVKHRTDIGCSLRAGERVPTKEITDWSPFSRPI